MKHDLTHAHGHTIARTTKRQPRPSVIVVLAPSSEAVLVGAHREVVAQGWADGVDYLALHGVLKF